MGGQGLHPQGLGGSENLGASETGTSTTEETVYAGGLPQAWILNSDEQRAVRPQATIQDAIDAVPLGPDDGDAAGRVYIPAKGGGGGNEKYDETVYVDDLRMIVEGDGPGTRIDPGGGQSTPTFEIDNSDDFQLRDLWIDNKGSGDAIKVSSGNEIWLIGINVDNAGGYAVNLAPTSNIGRCFIDKLEIKGGQTGAFRVDVEECFFSNIHIHDELDHGIDKAFVLDNAKRIQMQNVKIALNDATEAFDYESPGITDMQLNTVYIGPDIDANGSYDNPVDLRGDRSQFTNMIIRNADLTLSNATEAIFHGYVSGSITHGTRTVVNGYSPNAGDPSSTGQWNTHSDTAYQLGATVVDTSNEGDLYTPLPPSATADWVRVSGTAV